LELPVHVPVELCPKCLLKTGLGDGEAASVAAAPAAGRPAVGELFGHYRLVRLLGAGGMGAVYEADDLESDRRVALKILSQRFDAPEARKRFLREGRLAAAINHPNSVYVFGTEEVGGVPVIAMELMPGGTLEERVRRDGPLDIRTAVDAALHIIGGLDAAHAFGILHRDIKPSNCFLDADGTVKIGDFGLSVSTEAQGAARVTVNEAFMGTPAFAAPEQLRGDELTVRSDIYSVGVTLFYLLTGRLPHESHDMVRLLAKVLENPAPSPAQYRPEVPARLCRAVQRCLEKCPTDRFNSYAELRRELVRFGSSGTKPAALAARCVAGVVDLALVGLPLLLAWRAVPAAELPWFHDVLSGLMKVLCALVVVVAYFALLEWRCGRTPGKVLLCLRVVDQADRAPGLKKALTRAVLFVALPVLGALILHPPLRVASVAEKHVMVTLLGHTFPATTRQVTYGPDWSWQIPAYWLGATLLLFCAARRRNGFAALPDRLTETRVVTTAVPMARTALPPADVPADAASKPQLGPFHVLGSIEGSAEWLTGYDSRLLRRVWIQQLPAGTPAVARALRNLGRAGRLRWIAGKRSLAENWDAYEALTGRPLGLVLQPPPPWRVVRFWLLDLVLEIQEGLKDGTLPEVLGVDRVWITAEGRAKLLAFPAPGVAAVCTAEADPTAAPPVSWAQARNFIVELATRLLENRPRPLYVVEFLKALPTLASAADAVQALQALMNLPAAVSRTQRLGIVAAGVAGPALLGLTGLLCCRASVEVALWVGGLALLVGVAFPALLAAAVAGEGLLLRAFGVAIVGRDGSPATRSQTTRRSLIAWLPCLVSPVLAAVLALWLDVEWAGTLVGLLVAGLTATSLALPERSLPDRLAATWLVPR
jgi:hypothetical protein